MFFYRIVVKSWFQRDQTFWYLSYKLKNRSYFESLFSYKIWKWLLLYHNQLLILKVSAYSDRNTTGLWSHQKHLIFFHYRIDLAVMLAIVLKAFLWDLYLLLCLFNLKGELGSRQLIGCGSITVTVFWVHANHHGYI